MDELTCRHVECFEGCLTKCQYDKDPLAESEANALHPLFTQMMKDLDLMGNPAAKAIFGVKK